MVRSYVLDGMFGFGGRARRSEWWLAGFGLSILSGLLSGAGIVVLFGPEALGQETHQGAAVVRLAMTLLVAWPILAVSVRRAHDRNHSGWLVFVYYVFGVGLNLYAAVFPSQPLGPMEPGTVGLLDWVLFVLALLQIGIGLWLLVTLGFLSGSRAANRHGPPET